MQRGLAGAADRADNLDRFVSIRELECYVADRPRTDSAGRQELNAALTAGGEDFRLAEIAPAAPPGGASGD